MGERERENGRERERERDNGRMGERERERERERVLKGVGRMGRDSRGYGHEMAVLASQGQGSNCHSCDFIKKGRNQGSY